MWKDPIVEEVRKQRQKIETDCKNDFDKIFEQAIETQKKFSDKLVSRPSSTPKPKEHVSEVP